MQGKWCKPSSQTVQKLNTLALFPWLKLLLPDTGYCESNINNVALRILDVPYGQYLDQKLWRLLLILAFRWTIHRISFGDNIGKKRSGNYNVMCCTVVGYYPDSLCGHSMWTVSVSRQPSFSSQPCRCYLCSRLCGGNTAFVRKVTLHYKLILKTALFLLFLSPLGPVLPGSCSQIPTLENKYLLTK